MSRSRAGRPSTGSQPVKKLFGCKSGAIRCPLFRMQFSLLISGFACRDRLTGITSAARQRGSRAARLGSGRGGVSVSETPTYACVVLCGPVLPGPGLMCGPGPLAPEPTLRCSSGGVFQLVLPALSVTECPTHRASRSSRTTGLAAAAGPAGGGEAEAGEEPGVGLGGVVDGQAGAAC
jgi:hypothetical protein